MNDAAIVTLQEDIRDVTTEVMKLQLAVKVLIERQETMIELVRQIAARSLEVG